MKKWLPLAGMFFGTLALVLLISSWKSSGADELDVIDTVGGEFSLLNGDGKRIGLKDFSGRPVLMFFGYVACPDVCPTTMLTLKKVKKQLGKEGEAVQVVFITLDPERDGPKEVKEYAAFWDPSFIGLTGSMEEIQDTTKKFRAFFKKKESGSAAGYLVAHTDIMYLLDGQGRTRGLYQLSDPVENIVNDVRKLL